MFNFPSLKQYTRKSKHKIKFGIIWEKNVPLYIDSKIDQTAFQKFLLNQGTFNLNLCRNKRLVTDLGLRPFYCMKFSVHFLFTLANQSG